MQSHPNTAKNSPAIGVMKHPSGFQTSDFEIYEPNRSQIESAARRGMVDLASPPRRRISPLQFCLAALALACLIYAATYFLLSQVLG